HGLLVPSLIKLNALCPEHYGDRNVQRNIISITEPFILSVPKGPDPEITKPSHLIRLSLWALEERLLL
ncbi:hypothetical protein Anapl_01857, partial [Anas platyrhynchos]